MACVEDCIKHDASYLKDIVYEILVVCSLQKKVNNDFLRKIVNIAIRYGLLMPKIDINFDDLPKRFKLENVFEDWELVALKSKVYDIFKENLFVKETCSYLNNIPQSSLIILENNVQIDLFGDN